MSTPLLQLSRIDMPEPVGSVLVVTDGHGLVALEFGAPEERLMRLLQQRFGPDVALTKVRGEGRYDSAVRAYFAGDFTALAQVPLNGGGTPFQQRVWAALREIPAGETRSYGDIAARIGSPGAARAVGLANSLNPISLAVPCHRVIGSTGALTGYGGGIARKQWLLAHEAGGRDLFHGLP